VRDVRECRGKVMYGMLWNSVKEIICVRDVWDGSGKVMCGIKENCM